MAEHTFKIKYKLTNGDEGTAGTFSLYDGEDGSNATIEIGEVVTLEPGAQAYVENVGSDTHAVLNIGIPAGADGKNAEITLNGVNVADPAFYAPIDSGLEGQILQSNGANAIPTWVDNSGGGGDTAHLYMHSGLIFYYTGGSEVVEIFYTVYTASETPFTAETFCDYINANFPESDEMADLRALPVFGMYAAASTSKVAGFYMLLYGSSTKMKVNTCLVAASDPTTVSTNDTLNFNNNYEIYDHVSKIF